MLAVALAFTAVGFIAGPIAALVARRVGKPAVDTETWRGIRRLLRWLAVSGISTHLLFNLVLAAGIAFALTQVGSSVVVNGAWLVVRLGALVTVVLAVASADKAASAFVSGWRPIGVQAVSLVGSLVATLILLQVAAYWGLFALRW